MEKDAELGFLGLHHYSDMILVREVQEGLELSENWIGLAPANLTAMCLIGLLIMIFGVEGWGDFSSRVGILPGSVVVVFSALVGLICLKVGLRKRSAIIDERDRFIRIFSGRFFSSCMSAPTSRITGVEIVDNLAFRGGLKPKNVANLVIHWEDGRAWKLMITSDHEKATRVAERVLELAGEPG